MAGLLLVGLAYELAAQRRLHRDRIAPGVEDAAAGPLIMAVGGDTDRARALLGLAHGLIALELAGRFPADADLQAAWDAGIAAFGR